MSLRRAIQYTSTCCAACGFDNVEYTEHKRQSLFRAGWRWGYDKGHGLRTSFTVERPLSTILIFTPSYETEPGDSNEWVKGG